MIEYIRGVLADKEITQVAVEAAGVGYAVIIPLSTYEKLPEPGKEIKIFIHYYMMREGTDVKLYGFSSKDEREVFRHLITVSGIGPKVAIGIMSGMSVDSLAMHINAGNTAALRKIPGVGPKMAERIVVELKGKLAMYITNPAALHKHVGKGRKEEAFAAMMALGYNDKQVTKAIDKVAQEISEDALVEEWIRKALQII
jgi:Holliday junction DNA helicase RuvA